MAQPLPLFFGYRSPRGRVLSQAQLDAVLASLRGCSKVVLTGHTSSVGDPESNRELGLRRAARVREVLLSHGFRRGQIRIRSAGAREPIASNRTPEGRAKNRRVDVRCIRR